MCLTQPAARVDSFVHTPPSPEINASRTDSHTQCRHKILLLFDAYIYEKSSCLCRGNKLQKPYENLLSENGFCANRCCCAIIAISFTAMWICDVCAIHICWVQYLRGSIETMVEQRATMKEIIVRFEIKRKLIESQISLINENLLYRRRRRRRCRLFALCKSDHAHNVSGLAANRCWCIFIFYCVTINNDGASGFCWAILWLWSEYISYNFHCPKCIHITVCVNEILWM